MQDLVDKFAPAIAGLLVLVVLAISMAVSMAVPGSAQVSGADKPTAGATPGGTDRAGASDADLWRQIRQGRQGTVAGQTKSDGLMIQSQGQRWREIRTGILPMFSAWALLATLALLSLFFAIRGRIRISHGMSGSLVQRFSLIERTGHWLLASSFIVLALTGMNVLFGRTLLLPLLGKENFALLTLYGKFVHNYVAFAFMVGLAVIAVMWIVHNLPSRHDIVWLLRAGGIFGGGHPPSKKFNAGQKLIFWVVILCGISISLSGWALLNPFTTTMVADTFELLNAVLGTQLPVDLPAMQEQQYQSIWHTVMALIMSVVVLAHIYIGTVGMEGALSAMTTGKVDRNWASEHHSLWAKKLDDNQSTAPEGTDDADQQPAQ